MSRLEINLKEDYKSFKTGSDIMLEGSLVILSGVNGAGKSQLITAIFGFDRDRNLNISRKVKIDGIEIKKEEIDFRSFKENIGLGEITRSTSQIFLNSIDECWQNYTGRRLDYNQHPLIQYMDSCIEAKNILLKSFTIHEFNNGIEYDDFKEALRNSNFVWRPGDRFTNVIGEIFYTHCLEINEKMKEVGRANFNSGMLTEAPWLKLNKLFARLKLDYRFKDTYEVKGVEINEQPKLFAIKSDGSIDESSSRNLSELSDGEKTIISLCFASIRNDNYISKKLLLLDELDSVLNPSLIHVFFEVIEEFFIKKGVMVVLSTHSPATISLSPDYSNYYEIFKPNISKNRVLSVSKNDYRELLIANKEFYDKISDQEARIKELQNTIVSGQSILIVTEGKTDWKYFLSALKFFHTKKQFEEIEENYFYRFGSEQDLKNNICGTSEIHELSDSKLKNYLSSLVDARKIDGIGNQIRIGIFDSDTNIPLVNDPEKNVYSFKIHPNGISTELLFKDEEIKTEVNGKRLFIGDEFNAKTKIHIDNPLFSLGGDNTNKAGRRTIIESDVYNRESQNVALPKEKFAQAIYEEKISISEDSWNNFKHIFENISTILVKKDIALNVDEELI